MNEQTLNRITKEAEVSAGGLKDAERYEHIQGYIAGATPYAERAEKLRECLQEISMIVTNGAYNSEILEKKINSALNNDL